MRKVLFGLIFVMLLTNACSAPPPEDTPENPAVPTPEATETPTPEPEETWPPVVGPDPSPLVGAFYYPWYFNKEVDGHWDHWGEGSLNPPHDIASDFYPVLGAYSVSDPAVLAQHFAWLRQAGVGVIISSWWGQYDPTDRALPLTLDIADHYGIKIAFHIEPYGGRTASSLAQDIHYIYNKYGDHPAFFWTTETSRYSPDDRPKGLFFIWASVVPDFDSTGVSPEYWQETLDNLHNENPGAIVLTDQNGPDWVLDGHFDGSYKYGVLDTDETGYQFGLDLPPGAWFVPGINPGFSARRIGYEPWVDTPRRNGVTYDDRWGRMFATGVEPAMVVITTFNEWHEGTQIEPAEAGVTSLKGYNYLDYEDLSPEGYLEMTREWANIFLMYEWPETSIIRLRMMTTSDWTDLYLTSGASWQSPEVISTVGEETWTSIIEGHLALNQPIGDAESGIQVEATFDLQFREVEDEGKVIFEIERGGLGATWVELYRQSGEEWVLVESFT
jgi:hypothetical protein